jgi:GTP pyrophosphokinase
VLDIIAFRIVASSIGECYRALGMIHHEYTPMIHKIKDYISVPKPNGYQSLHTTILGLFSFPVEIQIRTQSMDDIAEYGVAAHFVYSDRYGDESLSDSQSRWIKKLQEIVRTYKDLDDKE